MIGDEQLVSEGKQQVDAFVSGNAEQNSDHEIVKDEKSQGQPEDKAGALAIHKARARPRRRQVFSSESERVGDDADETIPHPDVDTPIERETNGLRSILSRSMHRCSRTHELEAWRRALRSGMITDIPVADEQGGQVLPRGLHVKQVAEDFVPRSEWSFRLISS